MTCVDGRQYHRWIPVPGEKLNHAKRICARDGCPATATISGQGRTIPDEPVMQKENQ